MSKSEAALTAGSCQDTGLRTNSLWPASPLSDAAPPSVSQGIHIPKKPERSRASKRYSSDQGEYDSIPGDYGKGITPL